VVQEVTKLYKKEQIDSIQIEVFGPCQKISTVVADGDNKTKLCHLHNKTSGLVTLL